MNHIIKPLGVQINNPLISLEALSDEFGTSWRFPKVNLGLEPIRFQGLELILDGKGSNIYDEDGNFFSATPTETTLFLGLFEYKFLTKEELYTLFSYKDINYDTFAVQIHRINKRAKEKMERKLIFNKNSVGESLLELSKDYRSENNLTYKNRLLLNTVTNYCAMLNDEGEVVTEISVTPFQAEILSQLIKNKLFESSENTNSKCANITYLRRKIPQLNIRKKLGDGHYLEGFKD